MAPRYPVSATKSSGCLQRSAARLQLLHSACWAVLGCSRLLAPTSPAALCGTVPATTCCHPQSCRHAPGHAPHTRWQPDRARQRKLALQAGCWLSIHQVRSARQPAPAGRTIHAGSSSHSRARCGLAAPRSRAPTRGQRAGRAQHAQQPALTLAPAPWHARCTARSQRRCPGPCCPG